MKKILAILLSAALLVPCLAVPAYAADTRVSSLHFTVDTSYISAGTQPDELDYNNIKVVCTDVAHWDGKSGYNDNSGSLPNLRVSISDLQCTNSVNSFKVGDSVKFKFWVEVGTTSAGNQGYYTNSSTTVHVRTADNSTGPKVKSVSKTRSGSEIAVTVTTNPIKGAYSEPIDLVWQSGSLGLAKWNAPEDNNCAGLYDVKLMRDGKSVYTQNAYNATSINLFPWMTKEGEYTFAVRSVPVTTGAGAKNSDWAESDGQDVSKEKVSDGSGQNAGGSGGSTSGKVGWQQVNGLWYYIYPDGTMKKNGWEKIQNLWYLFDANGVMQTGWKVDKGNTYYLDPTKGDMKTGWVSTSDGQWYWLNPNPQAGTEGAMWKNQFLDKDGYRYYLGSSGAMATGWTKVNNDQYYFRPQNDGHPKGSMVTNARVDGFWLGADGKWVKGQ